MSIFDKYYQSPNFDSSRLGSSQGPSNQSMQYFDEDEEDMEADALFDQFLADGVITDEEFSILSSTLPESELNKIRSKRPQPELKDKSAFDNFLSGFGDFLKNTDFQGARRAKGITPSVSPAASQFMDPDPLSFPSETIGEIPSENAFSVESAGEVNPMLREFSQTELDDLSSSLPAGVQRGSPQGNFLETFAESDGDLTDKQIAEFRQEARDMGTTFNPETGFSRDPFLSAQASRTSTPLPGQTLSQFLRYEDSPEQRTEQFVDEQGRLRNRFTPEAAELQGLSDFVQPSLDEREMRLAERDRQPDETQTQRDTRIAQSRTTGAQTEGLSFDEARRRAEGELAARGVRNPSASQVNALARSIQEAEPERLEALRIKTAKDEAKLNFEPKVVEIEGQKLIQLAPEYYQPVRAEPKEDEPFEPRILDHNNFTYFEIAPNRFQIQPSTGQTTADIIAIINEERKKEGLTPIEAPTPIETTTAIEGDAKGNKKLDKETARSIFNEAGGDAELARQIARERGFVL